MVKHPVKYIRPPRMLTIAHLAVLDTFRDRLAKDPPHEEKARLEILIAIYRRLYEAGAILKMSTHPAPGPSVNRGKWVL